jgi:small-conductance mechanosensitive channel
MTPAEILDFTVKLWKFEIFQIGETPVSVSSVVLFVVVLYAFGLASRFLTQHLLRRVLTRIRMDRAIIFTVERITHYIVVFVGILVAFQIVGIDLSGLVVILGFLSVGIGFGLQSITSNFIAGLILLFERPIRVGDRIVVGEMEGDVQEINMRATMVRNLNNVSILVPNSEFVSSHVINWSHRDPKIRLEIDVGVSYDSDLDTVIRALMEVAQENKDVLEDPAPDVLHRGFGDSAWDMRLRAWIGNPAGHHIIRSDLHCAIVRKFREYDVEIPFPQRDLHVRSPLPVPVSDPAGAGESAAQGD